MYIVIAVAGSIAVLILAGAAYQSAGLRADARRYPPPGRLVRLESGRKLHVFETGQGSPAVVFEAGISATGLNWRRVQEGVARFARTASYDRAGLGWSSHCGQDRVPSAIVAELREMLCAAAIRPPFVLVAHSFGALVARWFASHYPGEIAGLVLVDPLWPEEWSPMSTQQARLLARGRRLSRRGAFLARIGVVRLALGSLMTGSRLFPRAIGHAAGGRTMGVMDRLAGEVGKMPRELWPMVMAHWCNPGSFLGLSAHLTMLEASLAEARSLAPLRDVPVTVITGARNRAIPAGAVAAISPDARHIMAPNSGHWVHLDEPDLVIEAVRNMVSSAA